MAIRSNPPLKSAAQEQLQTLQDAGAKFLLAVKDTCAAIPIESIRQVFDGIAAEFRSSLRARRVTPERKKRKKFTHSQELAGLPVGEFFDALSPGLSLIKRASGVHSWSLLYRYKGRQRRWTFARLDRTSLKEARRKVRTRTDDPVGDKKSLHREEAQRVIDESNSVSYEQLVTLYIDKYAKKNQRSWRQTAAALRHDRFKSWKARPVTQIERRDVKKLHAEITGESVANQTRALLHMLFQFAIDEEIVSVNPVTVKRQKLASRDRVLSDGEIRSVWPVPLFQMMLLTGQRPTNVKEIERGEIEGNEWTIPAGKFKLKRPHVAPLVKTAIDTLAALPDRGDRYFASSECLGLIGLLDELGVPNARPKDLQRTVRTRLSGLDIWPDTAERLMGHSISGSRGAYDRHDFLKQKGDALRRWENELLRIVEGSGKVLRFGEGGPK